MFLLQLSVHVGNQQLLMHACFWNVFHWGTNKQLTTDKDLEIITSYLMFIYSTGAKILKHFFSLFSFTDFTQTMLHYQSLLFSFHLQETLKCLLITVCLFSKSKLSIQSKKTTYQQRFPRVLRVCTIKVKPCRHYKQITSKRYFLWISNLYLLTVQNLSFRFALQAHQLWRCRKIIISRILHVML